MNQSTDPSRDTHGACLLRALPAALALAFASAAPAQTISAWHRLATDPRAADPATLTMQERRELARAYGLERHLPRPDAVRAVVTNCNDAGAGSLRDAVASAASGDIIDATGLACGTISLSTGAIAIGVADLSIDGPGRGDLVVTNGAKYGRVFRHTGAGVLNITGMTITGGYVSEIATGDADTRGGCIFSNGAVNLGNTFDPTDFVRGVIVRQCLATSSTAGVDAEGGGVFALADLSLSASLVTGCRAIAQSPATVARGGGVAVVGSTFAMKYSEVSDSVADAAEGISGGVSAPFMDLVTISHSTIAGNDATLRAGGAYLGTTSGDEVLIENSTISGNTSGGEAGLVANVESGPVPGSIRLLSSTITANASEHPGVVGGALLAGPLELQSTIVSANNAAGIPSDLRALGSITGADNLLGATIGTMPPVGLIVTDNPRLGPLVGNGGPTRTHAPFGDSTAIDAGNNSAGWGSDQRGPGFARVIGVVADIGAVEHDPDVIFRNGYE